LNLTILLVPSLVWLPLFGALVIGFISKENKNLIRWIATLLTLATLAISAYIFTAYNTAASGYQFLFKVEWLPSFGISYHVGVDGISCVMILLNAVCSFAAVIVSFSIRERVKEYFIFLLTLIASLFGVFTAVDLFFLYLFYEMAVIPMYPLIATWGSTNKEYGAMKLTLYITTGAVVSLLGLLTLYQVTGLNTFDLIEIQNYLALYPLPVQFQKYCAPLFIFGFGVIASLWPFHSWSPIGYAAAPSPISMLHAGVLKKIGIYALIRIVIGLMPDGARIWFPYVSILAVINILYGAWAAMAQKDLKFVVGFASVSHMGYALLGLCALNNVALTGTVFFMFAHGVMAALCFALIGFIYDQTHTRQISDLGGLAKTLPFIATCFVMAALASSGLPGFANFVSEILIFFGSFEIYKWQTICAIFGIVLTATYMLRLIRNVFFGALNPKWEHLKDAKTLWARLPFGFLIAFLLLFGTQPMILLDIIRPTVRSMMLSERPILDTLLNERVGN